MYTDLVMDHFTNPRNVGIMEDADAIGREGNPVCGDMMELFLKIEDGRIVDVKFRTFGCGAAIATSSIATEMVKGKTIEESFDTEPQRHRGGPGRIAGQPRCTAPIWPPMHCAARYAHTTRRTPKRSQNPSI